MSSRDLQAVIEQADRLSLDEQLQLLAYLVEKARHAAQPERPRVTWRDLRGALPYGLYGEDAQVTISQERQESDDQRASAIKR
jgi:hypothetical protein